MAVVLAACSDDDASTADDADSSTTDPAVTTTTTTEPEAEAELLDVEFSPVDEGRHRVEGLGIPLTFTTEGKWSVQPNYAGFTVLSHPDSEGSGDRDVVFLRPNGLAEPDAVNVSVEEFQTQDGWPLDDFDGWLDRVLPGVVDGDPEDTTLGGLAATRFEVALADDFPCGPQACVGMATNAFVDSIIFDTEHDYTVWWVDGGEVEPLVVVVGRPRGDAEWSARAEALLETVEFGEPGPHPVGDRHPWEVGLPSEVPGGERIRVPTAGGLEFVVGDPGGVTRFVFQARGFLAVQGLDQPTEIDMLAAVADGDGEPIPDVQAAVDAIGAATLSLDELPSTGVPQFGGVLRHTVA